MEQQALSNYAIDHEYLGKSDDLMHQFYGPSDLQWFVKKIYGETYRGQLVLYSFDDQIGRLADSDQSIIIALKAFELAKTVDLFFCISLLRHKLFDKNFNGSTGELIVPGLWVNIKVQCSNNRGNQFPLFNDAVNFLKSQTIKPDVIVNAGSELQAYWISDEPIVIKTAAQRNEITKMSYNFQQKIIAEGCRYGWQIDDTSTIVNLQRLPGTWNRTCNPAFPINILEIKDI